MRPLHLLLLLYSVLALFSVEEARALEDERPALVDGGHYDCLPLHQFGLAGLRLWDAEESIESKLGKPAEISKGSGEDDGGPYEIIIYHYPHLQVEAVRGSVDRIITESSSAAMPSGVRVGDSLDEVVAKLGRKPRAYDEKSQAFQIVTCPQNGKWIEEDYVSLKFDESLHLVSIAYEANRP
jgi:hypothetical protein